MFSHVHTGHPMEIKGTRKNTLGVVKHNSSEEEGDDN